MRKSTMLPLLLAAVVVLAVLAIGGPGVLGQLTEGTTAGATPGAAPQSSTATARPGAPAPSRPGAAATPASGKSNPSGLPAIRESDLPVEGRRVLALIRAGGPFRYSQDDQAFGNFEGVLPRRESGYYREYTVPTPGETDRGARRIVAGAGGEKYYTGDHYGSFSFITEGS